MKYEMMSNKELGKVMWVHMDQSPGKEIIRYSWKYQGFRNHIVSLKWRVLIGQGHAVEAVA